MHNEQLTMEAQHAVKTTEQELIEELNKLLKEVIELRRAIKVYINTKYEYMKAPDCLNRGHWFLVSAQIKLERAIGLL